MVRTRDFLLFLLTAAVLLLAIVGTEVWHAWRSLPLVQVLVGESDSSLEYTAEVPAMADPRPARLEELRAKVVSRLGNESVAVAPEVVDTPATSSPSVPAATSTTVATIKQCPSYRTLTVPWTPQSIIQENREGVRVYYERGLPDSLSSTTPELLRAVVPLRSWPLPNPTCLPTDVIGIAMDGSLIRNDELALYTVFGADTLIGYSLDGFPIYGASTINTDACGGAMVGGTYRYVLDAKRKGLITCFAGAPAVIN